MDELKLLRGEDIIIPANDDKKIILRQPIINEICDFGEDVFFNTFTNLCAIPSDMKSVLWDDKIDYMKISDFELFVRLSRNKTSDHTRLILGDLDLSKSVPKVRKADSALVLYLEDEDIIIDELIYEEMISYIRAMFGIVPKIEKARNKFTKQVLIDEDRAKRENLKNTKFTSIIVPRIITLVNTEEFPYDYKEVFNMTYYQLTKSLIQINNKKQKCALLQGRMSGFIDTSKLKQSDLQWMYEK